MWSLSLFNNSLCNAFYPNQIPLNVRIEKPQPLIDYSFLGNDYSPDSRPSDWQCPQVQRLGAGGPQLPASASRAGIGTSVDRNYQLWAARQSMVRDSGCHGATG